MAKFAAVRTKSARRFHRKTTLTNSFYMIFCACLLEIKPSQLTCRFWPQRPNSLEVAPPTSPALITSYQQWQVEFKEIAIRIFKKDAAGNVQRGKYLSITVCPPQGGTNVSPRALDAAPLRTFRWLNISILQVDLEFRSRTGGVMAGYVLLDFNPDTGNILFDKDLLSFSTRIVSTHPSGSA